MNQNNIRTQFDLIAKQYDEGRKCFIPCFDDFYVRAVGLMKNLPLSPTGLLPTGQKWLPQQESSAKKIVDLGAGTGLLTKEMYMLYPDAQFTLIDLSDDMLNVARKRFEGLTNFEYITADYSKSIPCDADIICSALSIHHLEDNEKQSLYNEIYKKLPEGGVFINLDQFCADSPIINKAWDEWWLDYIDNSGISAESKAKWMERKKLDREVSIQQTISMLHNAGFVHAECVYQFMKFGTIIAIK